LPYAAGAVAQSKHQIEALLAEAGSHRRHRFGQKFMIDPNLVRLVAEAGDVRRHDVVVEVGPGTGTLTEELLERGGRVVVVEIDRDLAALLRKRYGGRPNFSLVEGDALAGKHELNPELLAALRTAAGRGEVVKLVANLPYNIASPLVIGLLVERVQTLAFTVQKEVADRLRAGAGSDDYGPLTVMVQLLARVEVLRNLPPQAFWPAPKIDSSLVRLERDDRLGGRARPFGQFVHALFSFRRKTLRRALAQAGFDADAVLAATGFDGRLRPEVFTPDQLLRMYEATSGGPGPAPRKGRRQDQPGGQQQDRL
jgi:16S rRNA (adenine1518-N6/adenine1519-N6)-dimethyltransferase